MMHRHGERFKAFFRLDIEKFYFVSFSSLHQLSKHSTCDSHENTDHIIQCPLGVCVCIYININDKY
jgi:hypothetical protein